MTVMSAALVATPPPVRLAHVALLLTASATCLAPHSCRLLLAFRAQVGRAGHLTRLLKFRPFVCGSKEDGVSGRGQRSPINADAKVSCHMCLQVNWVRLSTGSD